MVVADGANVVAVTVGDKLSGAFVVLPIVGEGVEPLTSGDLFPPSEGAGVVEPAGPVVGELSPTLLLPSTAVGLGVSVTATGAVVGTSMMASSAPSSRSVSLPPITVGDPD